MSIHWVKEIRNIDRRGKPTLISGMG